MGTFTQGVGARAIVSADQAGELAAGGAPVAVGGEVAASSPIGVPEHTNSTLKAALFGLPQGIPMPVKRGGVTLATFDTAANLVTALAASDDTSDPHVGPSSVLAPWPSLSISTVTPVDANQPFMGIGYDVTGKNIEISVKRLSTSSAAFGSTGLVVRLYSAGTPAAKPADYHSCSITKDLGDAEINDDWQVFSLPIERFTATGAGANLAAITFAGVTRSSGKSGSVNMLLGDIRAQPRVLTKALCVFCFSDNRADTWGYAAQQLSRFGFPAYATPGAIASNLQASLSAFNMSAKELRKLQSLHNWQIGSQAFTTEDSADIGMSDDAFLAELAGIHNLYRAVGLWGAVDGSYNPAFPVTSTNRVPLLRQAFRTMRASYTHSAAQNPWPETAPIGDPMRLKSFSRNPTTNSGAQLIAYCQKAVDTKGIAVFSYHSLASNETVHGGETKTAFLTLLDWLHANRDIIEVATIDTAITRMAAG